MATGPISTTKGFHDPRYRALIGLLIEARKGLKLSQQGLADRLGRHQQFVSRYEIGDRRLDVVEFADIARNLDCNFDDILRNIPPAAINLSQI